MKKVYKGEYDEEQHAVKDFGYESGHPGQMLKPKITTWCGKEALLGERDRYTKYVKERDKDSVCHDCKKAISLYQRRKRRRQANS